MATKVSLKNSASRAFQLPCRKTGNLAARTTSFRFRQLESIVVVNHGTIPRVPAKEPKRDFKVGDKVRVNLHHGKIEDAIVRVSFPRPKFPPCLASTEQITPLRGNRFPPIGGWAF